MCPSQSKSFLSAIHSLIDDDAHGGYFKVCLRRVLLNHLDARPKPKRKLDPTELASDYCLTLSTLAHAGHVDSDAAQAAYASAVIIVEDVVGSMVLQPAEACLPARFEACLERMMTCREFEKRKFLLACARSVASDGVVERVEMEMLRAVAEGFGCPIPPMLGAFDARNRQRADPREASHTPIPS
jgi:hypothetical protein